MSDDDDFVPLDPACPYDGCDGEVDGGEFFDGSESECDACGRTVVCTVFVDKNEVYSAQWCVPWTGDEEKS